VTIRIKLDVSELTKAAALMQRFGESLGDALTRHLLTVGPRLEKDIKQTLNVGGRTSGRGPRGGRIVTHSAPGEPPRKQTGRLQSSIGYEIETVQSGSLLVALKEFGLKVGAIRKVRSGEVKYAEGLELGTSKMLPRPWLIPAVMKEIATWGKGLQKSVEVIRE
jgi:hypothetical protein